MTITVEQRDLLQSLQQNIEKHAIKRLFVIADKGSFVGCGAEKILQQLPSIEYTVFSDFETNPKFEDVQGGITTLAPFDPDCLLAIGGGSTIDFAKLVVALAPVDSAQHKPLIYGEIPVQNIACPLWVAPTTSGTGSEATHFAVVYEGGAKYSLASDLLLPTQIFLDPALTRTVPEKIAVGCAMDALCQAIESYWAMGATHESRGYAIDAINYIVPNFTRATCKDEQALAQMQMGSYLAGKAINISKTTAGHAFSYYLTSHHNIMHGHAVGIMLSHMMEYALQHGDDTIIKTITTIADTVTIEKENFPTFIRGLLDQYNMTSHLKDVADVDFNRMVNSVNIERLSNNPFTIDPNALRTIVYG